jgi:hypothetical protein
MLAIRGENVNKIFGETAAVDSVSLTFPEGAIYDFIRGLQMGSFTGPKGSGEIIPMTVPASFPIETLTSWSHGITMS